MKNYLLIIFTFFTAVSESFGQVVYTEVNPAMNLCISSSCDDRTYEFDFNNDGIVDLLFWFDSFKTAPGCISSQYIKLFSMQPTDTAELLMDMNGDLAYLNYLDTVKPSSSIQFADYFCLDDDIYKCPFLLSSIQHDCESIPSETTGHYGSFVNKYIGVKLKILNEYHYCWIKVAKSEGVNLKVSGYAYNLTPDEELVIEDPNYNSLFLEGEIKAAFFPNPMNDYLVIELESNAILVEVYDVLGKLIHTENHTASNFHISTSTWKKGVYFCKVITEKGSATRRIIKN